MKVLFLLGRLVAGLAITVVLAASGIILHLLFAAGIDRIPENREKVPFLPGEGGSSWLIGVMLLATWSVIVLALSKGLPASALRRSVYIGVWVVVLPIAFLNYAHFDMLINRTGQAILNIVLVFLGLVLATELFRLQPQQPDVIVLRIIALFFTLFSSVFIPGLFSIIWFLSWINMSNSAITDKASDSWLMAVCALLSGAFSFQAERKRRAAGFGGSATP